MAKQAVTTGPKYRRIADDLLAGIQNGDYPPGSQLPTKAELMARYHVAVNTVERAIKELRSAGVVETAQGAGMFVREPPVPPTSSAATVQRIEDLQSEIAALRDELGLLQAQVMDLHHSTGQDQADEQRQLLGEIKHEVQDHARLLARMRQSLEKAGITLTDADQRDGQAMLRSSPWVR